MKVSDESVREFIKIWKNEFGETLEYDAALLKLQQLIHLYRELARPIPDELNE